MWKFFYFLDYCRYILIVIKVGSTNICQQYLSVFISIPGKIICWSFIHGWLVYELYFSRGPYTSESVFHGCLIRGAMDLYFRRLGLVRCFYSIRVYYWEWYEAVFISQMWNYVLPRCASGGILPFSTPDNTTGILNPWNALVPNDMYFHISIKSWLIHVCICNVPTYTGTWLREVSV